MQFFQGFNVYTLPRSTDIPIAVGFHGELSPTLAKVKQLLNNA